MKKWYFLFAIKIVMYNWLSCQNITCDCPLDTTLPSKFKQNWMSVPLSLRPQKTLERELDYPIRRKYRILLDSLFWGYFIPNASSNGTEFQSGILSDLRSKKISKKCIMAYFGKPNERKKSGVDDDDDEHWTYYFRVLHIGKRNKRPLRSEFFIFVFEKHSKFAYRAFSRFSGE